MVKIATRALKIGVQSPFGPISTVGTRTFFPKKFGQAYCTCGEYLSVMMVHWCLKDKPLINKVSLAYISVRKTVI